MSHELEGDSPFHLQAQETPGSVSMSMEFIGYMSNSKDK